MQGVFPQRPSLLPWQGIELRLPMAPWQPHVLRAVATSIAMHEEFTMDIVADLELVVDEMHAALSRVAAPIALLRCVFSNGGDGLTVHAYTFAEPGADLPRTTVGQYMIAALAHDVHTWQTTAHDCELDQWHIRATMRRHSSV